MASYALLKQMLDSWNSSELFEHFKDEGINVEELQLMKPHHIVELLGHFKMGVRIRFEHYFELWRRDINVPLKTDLKYVNYKELHVLNGTVSQSKPSMQTQATNTDVIDKAHSATNTVGFTTMIPGPIVSVQPNAVELPKQVEKLPKSPDILHNTPPPTMVLSTSPTKGSISQPVAITTQRIVLRSLPQKSDAHNAKSKTPTNTASRKTREHSLLNERPQSQNADGSVSLKHILEKSGSKGKTLLKYFREHQSLTNAHRVLLIHLIVGYFEINDFHLSLNMSHHLENQIISLFPTEKLEYYRTEKRGKIYVKFCNMKRYRRDRPAIKRCSDDVVITGVLEPTTTNDSTILVGDDDDDIDDDGYAMDIDFSEQNSALQIKTEDSSEAVY